MESNCPICKRENVEFTEKSHIIPNWMYEKVFTQRNKAYGKIVNKTVERKLQSGYYDTIICTGCEAGFSKDDHYISRVLKGDLSLQIVTERTKRIYKKTNDVMMFETWRGASLDHYMLKRFILGVFLRGFLYNLKNFPGENGSVPEKHFDGMVKSYHEPKDDCSYPVLMFKGFDKYKKFALLPFPLKPFISSQSKKSWKEHHSYAFLAYGFYFIVFVSSHQKDPQLMECRLKSQGDISVPVCELGGYFSELAAILKDIHSSMKKTRIDF